MQKGVRRAGQPYRLIKEVNIMKLPRNLGMILLSILLIAWGLLQVISVSIPGIGTILAILAIAAGALLLFNK
jgi:hypothetical protein